MTVARAKSVPEVSGPSLFSGETRTVRLFAGMGSPEDPAWRLLCGAGENGDVPVDVAPGLVPPGRLRARRCTEVLGDRGGSLAETEHLCAALAFWRGPKAIAWCDGGELPACDGSARAWVAALRELPGARFGWSTYPAPLRRRWVWEEGFLEVEPSDRFEAEVVWAREGLEQRAALREGDSFDRILEARSFVSARELEEARKEGLLAGVAPEMGYLWEKRDGRLRVLEGGELRDPDEFAAHKLLDLVGDLALAAPGLPRLKIRARNAGHFWHHRLVASLLLVLPPRM